VRTVSSAPSAWIINWWSINRNSFEWDEGRGERRAFFLLSIGCANSVQPVDQRRDVSGSEAIIDIDDADVRGAGVEHAEQRCHPFERCAIANAGGNGDHRNSDETSDDAGQRALHPRTNDHDTSFGQRLAICQQTMDAGDADIVEVLDFVSHHFGGDDSLFRDRDVAGSRRDYGDDAFAVFRCVLLQDDGAGERAVVDAANSFLYRSKLFFIRTCGEDVASVLRQSRKNSGYLRRRFPLAEDDFRHASAQCAVMIDLGKPEIFKWKMAKAVDGIVGLQMAFSDFFEELADGLGVHVNQFGRDSAQGLE